MIPALVFCLGTIWKRSAFLFTAQPSSRITYSIPFCEGWHDTFRVEKAKISGNPLTIYLL